MTLERILKRHKDVPGKDHAVGLENVHVIRSEHVARDSVFGHVVECHGCWVFEAADADAGAFGANHSEEKLEDS